MLQVSKAPQEVIRNLGVAFKLFFERHAGHPRFKKKDRSVDSYRADYGAGIQDIGAFSMLSQILPK
jgi:hypothetical protein